MTQNDLVVSHIPLVHATANRLDAPHLKDDLVGEGMVALVRCAKRFDPGRGVPFGAYARHRVKGAMVKYLARNEPTASLEDRDDDGVPHLETVGSDGQADVTALRDALRHHLHPVEEWVVTKRYFDKSQIEDMAAELGFKVSRVSQIHSNALRKLRKAFAPAENGPRGEGDDERRSLLQVVSSDTADNGPLMDVVRRMIWDEWGVEVIEG